MFFSLAGFLAISLPGKANEEEQECDTGYRDDCGWVIDTLCDFDKPVSH
jgi:hypothetical protein